MRDASLTIYVERETKYQLRREADDRALSIPDYCLGLTETARKAMLNRTSPKHSTPRVGSSRSPLKPLTKSNNRPNG